MAKVSSRLKKVLVALTAGVVLFALEYVPTGLLAVYPGPLANLGDIVHIQGYPAKNNSFFMVSVIAKDANIYTAIRGIFDRNVDLWPASAVFGSRSPEEYMQENQKLMDESKARAVYLALKKEGMVTSFEDPVPVTVEIDTGEVAGPSAGLAFYLEILLRVDKNLSLRGKVAATGMLDASGSVLPVGGVAQKTIACRQYGIDVFLVPQTNYDEAKAYAKNMTVIGVSDVNQAFSALLSIGALEIP